MPQDTSRVPGSIVLFTTPGHGDPYIESVARFTEEHGRRLDVVFSAHPNGTQQDLRNRMHARRRRLSDLARYTYRLGRRPIFVPDVNDSAFVDWCRGRHGIVAAFSQIFRPNAIESFATLINVHASILPLYKGPDPIGWCVANNERRTGYTVHTITESVDEGPILHQEAVEIQPGQTADDVAAAVATLAAMALPAYLATILHGSEWATSILDAASVYTVQQEYAPRRDQSSSQPVVVRPS